MYIFDIYHSAFLAEWTQISFGFSEEKEHKNTTSNSWPVSSSDVQILFGFAANRPVNQCPLARPEKGTWWLCQIPIIVEVSKGYNVDGTGLSDA